ncbi:glycoside hydrolase family 47 protein [Aspergillus stella-maris]|uniref:glycoside hydrolase family 47 protein n=1 Tax=Aspergillus stella-maris TaxID=1810926 RepID=UPI003CCD0770
MEQQLSYLPLDDNIPPHRPPSNSSRSLQFESIESDSYWELHRQEVKDTFITSWDAYAKYAWGKDQFYTLTKRGTQMSPTGLGWIIVDSLDTLMLMNLTTHLSNARKWLTRSLNYDQDQDVNTFEMTIRMLGGLLSAHYLSTVIPDVSSRRDYIYLSKATDLADRLLSAFKSPSGIPWSSIHLAHKRGIPSHADGGASSTAEVASLQLEMKLLSYLRGNERYWRKRRTSCRLGSRGDSYCEYLSKQYLQISGQEPIYRELWDEAPAGIQKHLATSTKHSRLQFIAELPQGIGGPPSPKMDHLVCFSPGSIALANALARELTKTCLAMYAVTDTGLPPEIVWFEADEEDLRPSSESRPSSQKPHNITIKPLDAHNLQRLETVESLFLIKHTLVSDGRGYTSLQDVTKIPLPKRNNMESFWLAETLKYLHLLFSPRGFLPLSEVVFKTDAHILPRFNQTKFRTGWERMKRP